MILQLVPSIIFLSIFYIVSIFIIYLALIFSKKFYISSREDLVKFIELKDSVINNLKSEINNLKSEINNLKFERNSLSELLDKNLKENLPAGRQG
jgi:cell shape-determining protein MreC